jgi:hypothetical protein
VSYAFSGKPLHKENLIISAGGKDKIDGFFNSNPEFLHVLETM